MKKAKKESVRYPSAASLKDMPELAPGAKLRRNPYAAKIAEAGGFWSEEDGQPAKWVPSRQGRPKKDAPSEQSKPRSLRLPDSVWSELQARAEAEGVGVHTLLRQMVASYLAGPAKVQPRTRTKRQRSG